MKRATHERALRATAKVAAAAALFGGGCGGNTPAATANGADTKPTASVADGQGQPVLKPVPVGSSAAIANKPAPDASNVAVCTEIVKGAAATRPEDADIAVKECCRTLADSTKQPDGSIQGWMGEGRWLCCEVLTGYVGIACIPWGPPTPPSMQWGIA